MATSLTSTSSIRRISLASSIWTYPSLPPGPWALSRMPDTLNCFPLTDPSLLVVTMTTVSPGFTPIPMESNSGTRISPLLRCFSPLIIREGKRGIVLNSLSGFTPFNRMLVVSTKVLNMPPNLMRGEYASTSGSPLSTSSNILYGLGLRFMVSGRLSTAAIYPFRCTCRCPKEESVICAIIMFLKDPAMEMYPRTKTTPIVMRDAVNNVLLL